MDIERLDRRRPAERWLAAGRPDVALFRCMPGPAQQKGNDHGVHWFHYDRSSWWGYCFLVLASELQGGNEGRTCRAHRERLAGAPHTSVQANHQRAIRSGIEGDRVPATDRRMAEKASGARFSAQPAPGGSQRREVHLRTADAKRRKRLEPGLTGRAWIAPPCVGMGGAIRVFSRNAHGRPQRRSMRQAPVHPGTGYNPCRPCPSL